MTKHTQGPWGISNNATENREPTEWLIGCGGVGGGKVVATITNAHEEASANAHLIAAAPELLEACEWLMATNSYWWQEVDEELWHDIRKAIAKAKGNPLPLEQATFELEKWLASVREGKPCATTSE